MVSASREKKEKKKKLRFSSPAPKRSIDHFESCLSVSHFHPRANIVLSPANLSSDSSHASTKCFLFSSLFLSSLSCARCRRRRRRRINRGRRKLPAASCASSRAVRLNPAQTPVSWRVRGQRSAPGDLALSGHLLPLLPFLLPLSPLLPSGATACLCRDLAAQQLRNLNLTWRRRVQNTHLTLYKGANPLFFFSFF